MFITSKLWNTKHNPSDVRPALMQTLSDLGLDYLDLYLIHWPIALKDGDEPFPKDADSKLIYAYHDPCDTWQAMETLVNDGLVRAIGNILNLCNFSCQQYASKFLPIQKGVDNLQKKLKGLQLIGHGL